MSRWNLVAKFDDFQVGEPIIYDFEYETAALYRIGDTIFAIEDRCSHDDGPLAEGRTEGCQVICPRHGARFDITTGKALSMPATEAVATYPVKIEDGSVYIQAPEE